MTNHLRHATIGILAVLGVGLVSASVRADADSTKEVATAARHAGLAAQAADLKGTQTHLHHVLNCLVGPKGQGFDDKEVTLARTKAMARYPTRPMRCEGRC
jgi:hypothetical protein